MDCLMHVGPDPKTVPVTVKALLSLMQEEKCGDEVKVAAITALTKSLAVSDVTVSHCTLTNTPPRKYTKRATTGKTTRKGGKA